MPQKTDFLQFIRRSKLVIAPLSDSLNINAAAGSGADAFIINLTGNGSGGSLEAPAKIKSVVKELSLAGGDLFLWVAPSAVRRALENYCLSELSGLVITVEKSVDVKTADKALTGWKTERKLEERQILLDLVLASSPAIFGMYDLAAASPWIVSLTLDEKALLSELGLARSLEIDQLLYPRGRSIIVARMFHIQAHCLGFVQGEESLLKRAMSGRKIGLRGALCFHPADVPALNQGFSPAEDEVTHAIKVKEVMQEAVAKGLGSAKLPGGAMVDMAMFKHSQALLRWHEAIMAKELGKKRKK